MHLSYKNDLDDALKRWDAYWQNEIIDRPAVCVRAPKAGVSPQPEPPYMDGIHGGWPEAISRYERYAAATYFGGEMLPYTRLEWGPDQFALFFGGEYILDEAACTSWIRPYVQDWQDHGFALEMAPGSFYQKTLEYFRMAAEYSEGKFLLGMLDLHSNLDCLSAMRSPQKLCLDLYDCSDLVDAAVWKVRRQYPVIYDSVFEAGNMRQRGSIGWAPFYSRDKFAVVQCDFIALIGNDAFRRLVLPCLREEAGHLDHCLFHLDGPDALRHLDDILDIEEINAIQWVPGDGQPKTYDWMELLQKIQASGKGLHIQDWNFDAIKRYYRELKPHGVVFDLAVNSEGEADAILEWLARNT